MIAGIVRKILSGISLTSVLFVFQACYGTPHDMEMDNQIEGLVRAKATNVPVQGIKVSSAIDGRYAYTGDDGKFSMFLPLSDNYTISFIDVDSTINGSFVNCDTVISDVPGYIYLDILLDTK